MQTTLVHAEDHVALSVGLAVDNESMVAAVVRHSILLDDVLEGNDVGNGFLAEPYRLVVALQFRLLSHFHAATVASNTHGGLRVEYLHHHVRVADQIHGGLVVKENHFV